MKITGYKLHRLNIPLREPIGDSQVYFDEHWMTIVELVGDDGQTGVGFDIQQGIPTASLADQEAIFEHVNWPSLEGESPLSLGLRITRPRGGNVGVGFRNVAVETALWDLAAKQAGLPLYKMLGGQVPEVRAYASTLDFHLDDTEFRNKLENFHQLGFRAVKIKVGHPDVGWDLRRMGIAVDVMGQGEPLMVDANEAWSVKEAMLRMHAYRDAGFEIYWIEDPITREDFEGYARLCGELPFTRVNTGEYLGYSGKRRLIEAQAVDVVNVHGSIGISRDIARLAADYGVPVSLGNTIMEIGVHLAASLPECLFLEFSDIRWNELAVEPVQFHDGLAIAPDRPGHGIELDPEKLAHYSAPGG